MFEGSLVESTALLQTRNRWPALLSFTAQALVALVILAIPMLHPELLPMHAPSLALAPPPPPPHPPTPPPPQHVHAALVSTEAPTAPAAPQAQRAFLHTLLPTALPLADTPIFTSVGPRMGGDTGSNLGVLNGTNPGPAVTVATPASPAHAGIVHLSTGVTAGLLLGPIQPAYPALARTARVEGTVVIRAIISRAGRIESAQVVSGPAMLQTAALQAVEQARYRPYLLNGQATEVDTTVTITFRLSS